MLAALYSRITIPSTMNRSMRLLILTGTLLWVPLVSATNYYISFSSGSNANNGTSKAHPWKTHPYMQTAAGCTTSGSAPTYAHSAGDVFTFKQGDSWPNACFDMVLGAGGSNGNPDIYTFDPTWGTPPTSVNNNAGQITNAYQFTAGGSVINGVSGINRFISTNGHSNVSINGAEFTGMLWSGNPSFGTAFIVDITTDQNIIVSTSYFHGWPHTGATGDVMKAVAGRVSSPFNAGSQVTGSVFDGTGATDSGEAVYAVQMADNNIVKNMSNGILPNVNAIVHDNTVGPINTSFDATNHENCFEPIGLPAGVTSTEYFYNNIWHDCAAVGILTQGGAASTGIEKVWLWNNVAWIGSTSSPPIPFQFDTVSAFNGSCEVHMYNNTIYAGSGQQCAPTVNRGNGPLSVLDVQNHHCITDRSPTMDFTLNATTYTNANNTNMGTATAIGQGYNASETYAYSPTLITNSTVGAGANLSTLVTGSLSSLQNDTTYGGIRSTIARPGGSSAWDTGAYQWGSEPAPPTNLQGIVN